MIGIVGNNAIALNGQTSAEARRGLKFRTSNGTTLNIIAPDQSNLVQAGIVRPNIDPLFSNRPISEARERALARCRM